MIENKVRSKKVKRSIREKIIMTEKRSIRIAKIKTFLKKNFLKIAVSLLALLAILIYINANKRINVDEYSNISKLKSSKYSSEIVSLYNRNGQLDIFRAEMNRVQSLVGIYLISNSTIDENSFSGLIKVLNSEINNTKWTRLNSEKSIYYSGKYSIDDSGNLKFKFDDKKIQPDWINDESISRYVILN